MRRRQMLARVARLDALMKGLAKEAAQQIHAEVERQRRKYVAAVRKAKDALDEARAALADAARRLKSNPLA